tara:strand:+ start:696 stop:1064 length:369 start_codon:yes stop_codon:yes gene_type:complete
MNFKSQEIRFIKNALYVWTIGQIILHFSLFFLSISLSVFISAITSIPLRYYFYGKNVFGLNKPSFGTAKKFLILSILIWILNTVGTKYVHSFGLNKNISAIIMIPFIASISFFMQKYYVFKK